MQKLQPFVWFIYIDDIFFIWTHGEAELKKFMEKINTFAENVNLHRRTAFVDINFSLENGSITADLQIKSTDFQQYLHCSSSNPDHVKNSILYCQTFIRIRRNLMDMC